MFKQYREIEAGEFILVAGDCSQGGADKNACHFISKTKLDIPMVYHSPGVAAQMTTDLYPVLNKIFATTHKRPMVALERNNGGASEMERLRVLNREEKYQLFVMPTIGQVMDNQTKRLGYDMNSATRPIVVGGLKNVIDSKTFKIYDEETIQQLFWFIINRNGKPEAIRGKHDDLVMSLGIGVQLFQLCEDTAHRIKSGGVPYDTEHRSWGISSLDAYR